MEHRQSRADPEWMPFRPLHEQDPNDKMWLDSIPPTQPLYDMSQTYMNYNNNVNEVPAVFYNDMSIQQGSNNTRVRNGQPTPPLSHCAQSPPEQLVHSPDQVAEWPQPMSQDMMMMAPLNNHSGVCHPNMQMTMTPVNANMTTSPVKPNMTTTLVKPKRGAKREAQPEPEAATPPTKRRKSSDNKAKKPKTPPSEDREEKRQRALERNRIAASKCRENKKRKNLELQAEALAAEAKLKDLRESYEKYKAEALTLRNVVVEHGRCGDPGINSHVARMLDIIIVRNKAQAEAYAKAQAEAEGLDIMSPELSAYPDVVNTDAAAAAATSASPPAAQTQSFGFDDPFVSPGMENIDTLPFEDPIPQTDRRDSTQTLWTDDSYNISTEDAFEDYLNVD
ncbi:hypothetical protein BDV25DRAFT_167147 [Aspergillus avenaceus]|uniref:BZIP domain-containing protein n=1 Tax=Aspergillus avenaceus TaxID=36643 RepID=A0A5N6TDC5_ASPAV|nr:hypothetical protein BDV25DRAFT_167147 [Aspergillus avenaceus]